MRGRRYDFRLRRADDGRRAAGAEPRRRRWFLWWEGRAAHEDAVEADGRVAIHGRRTLRAGLRRAAAAAATLRRSAREQRRGPAADADADPDAAAPAAGGRGAGRRLRCDGAAAAPRRRLRQARRGRLPPPNHYKSLDAVARLEPEGPSLGHEANDLRLRPPRHREKESLRVARRFDAERRHPPAVDPITRRRRGDARL